MPRPNAFVLTLSCRDTEGGVHAVAGALDEADCNIVESQQFGDVGSLGPDDITAVGRDVESVALARAVRWHVEHRLLPNGRKTVVFR